MKFQCAVAMLALTLISVGCTPKVTVKKNPKDCDEGIRYYRPKPYLLVTPAGETKGSGAEAVTTPSDMYVTMELKYLPDFSEEYSIEVTPGIGTADVSVTLEDGWNLTSLNQTLDSKTAENITALGQLVGAVAPNGLVGTSKEGEAPPNSDKQVVAARNIPLGFYEAVIDEDRCGRGRKQLYGWRYVGFAPYNSCPLYAQGANCISCQDGTLSGSLYGLTFVNGVMVFKPLHRFHELTAEGSAETKLVIEPLPEKLSPQQIGQLNAKIAAMLETKKITVTGANFDFGDSTAENVSLTLRYQSISTTPVTENPQLAATNAIDAAIKELFPDATVEVKLDPFASAADTTPTEGSFSQLN